MVLLVLVYMATSGGHFSRPLGMGGYLSYSGYNITNIYNGIDLEGMTKFERNDTNLEGMTQIWKE